ncbi:MAG: AraC family transcriptional regulator [Bacteroidetes bacterium]|nr:AraC family transcriptional regulator [Bacteroidota bacterium]
MDIYTLPANEMLEHCIRRITIFQSGEYTNFRQKLTPTPYCCLTYNHFHIPDFEVNGVVAKSGQRLQVTGAKTRDDIYAIHYGKLSQILIEFTVAGFYFLFRRSPACLQNKTEALTELTETHALEILISDLSSTDDPVKHADFLQNFIASMNILKTLKFRYLENTIRLIEESNGKISVHSICTQINISERQLNRKFMEIIGLKPIQYIKLKQLHYIINLLHTEQFSSLKELAYETGFYDPAHFHNHFRKLTGMSPGAFLASDEHVAFKYYNDLVKE